MRLDTARADRIMAVGLCALGLAMLAGGLAMDLAPFLTRPIGAVFVTLIVLTIAAGLPPVRRAFARMVG